MKEKSPTQLGRDKWEQIEPVVFRGVLLGPVIKKEMVKGGKRTTIAESVLGIPESKIINRLNIIFPETIVEQASRLQQGDVVVVSGDLRTTFRADSEGYPVIIGGLNLDVAAVRRAEVSTQAPT